MIACGMNVTKERVKRMLINTYHHCGTLMRICHKNSGKNCFVTVKMRKKTILKVFGHYLMVVKNKNQTKILYCFFEPELGVQPILE